MIRVIKAVTSRDKVNLTLLDHDNVVLILGAEEEIQKYEHPNQSY